MLKNHGRRVSHFGRSQILVLVLGKVIAAKTVPQNVGKKRQTGRFRDSFERAMPPILQKRSDTP